MLPVVREIVRDKAQVPFGPYRRRRQRNPTDPAPERTGQELHDQRAERKHAPGGWRSP